jgi:hypothetical protein
MSIPAATFAMKAGPQTVMSQWIVSLNDNLDDEGSDNQHSAKWEDAQEKLQRFETETKEILNIFFASLVSHMNLLNIIQLHLLYHHLPCIIL